MVTKVPRGIIERVIAEHHALEVMCLVTADNYKITERGPAKIPMQSEKLRKLCWRGIESLDLQLLRQMLRNSASHLKDLDIATFPCFWVGHDAHTYSWCRDITIPTLATLCLRNIDFRQELTDVAAAFPLSNLQTLKLHACTNVSSLLSHWLASNQPISLKCFHVLIDGRPSGELMPLTKFLSAFTGLTNLCVVTVFKMNIGYTRSVLAHSETLQRFVHQFDLVPIKVPRLGYIQEYGYSDVDTVELRRSIGDLVCSPTLKCMGLSYPPDCLVGAVSSHQCRPELIER